MELKRLAHYEIVGPIGAGGMGEVYRARDTKLGRDVALKLLPEHFARDADRLARFEREARLLASLNHPRIAAIYGLEQDGAHRFLVLELIEGEDLSKRIARGPVPLDDALGIALHVCEALEAAHETGVVHRDLKPSNIVVTPNGSVKVLDFGLAKALDPASGNSNLTQSPTILGSSPTMQGVILGTAAYMSPEQARGRAVDKRADIFAFGCVLFEMLTGKLAFSGETVSDTLAAVLRADPDWGALPKDTPAAIARLLRRCLEKDPKRRLRDIGEAALVIDDVRSGRIVDEPTAVAAPSIPKARFVGPRAIAVVAIVLAAVAAGSSALTRLLSPSEAEPPFRKLLLDVVLTDSLGAPEAPRISPDGKRLAFHSGGRLWIRDLDNLEPRAIAESSSEVAPFWSPDGAFVGYVTSQRLWKVRAAGGDPTPVCDSPASFGGGAGASWGDDGRIVFSYGNGGVYEVSSSGGDAREIIPVDVSVEQDIHQPAMLPGGKGILYIQHRQQSGPDTIQLFANGTRKTLLTLTGQNLWSVEYAPSGHILFVRIPDNAGLWAAPFSLQSLEITGEPFLIAPKSSEGSASNDGALAYLPTLFGDMVRVARYDGAGKFVSYATETLTNVNSIALSPDGSKLAVSMRDAATRDVWVIDLVRNTRSRLTFAGNYNTQPAWSPDGKTIAYRNVDDQSLYLIPADGTGDRRFLTRGASFPCYSPDGRWIVFSTRLSGSAGNQDSDLFMVDASLTDTTRVTVFAGTGDQRYPVVSPDGNYVAYLSNESGNDVVYLTTFPRSTGKWQVSVHGDANWPSWAPTGDRIYFVADDRVEMVTFEPGAAPRLGTPQKMLDTTRARLELWGFQKLDVDIDGRGILVVEATRSVEQQDGVVFVENWLEEFSQDR
ncbi:MAG TPA: protein kinase [Candidatus Krumholzibacteria bacterium]|nr:protein kinase [Candidatus Krumholzibacteria bacterium]